MTACVSSDAPLREYQVRSSFSVSIVVSHDSHIRPRSPLVLQRMGVPLASHTDQILETTSVLQGQLDIRHEFFGHIDRKAFPTAATVKYIAAMAFACGTGCAVGPHTRTLTKRQRAVSNRPKVPDRLHEPLLDVICFLILRFLGTCAL